MAIGKSLRFEVFARDQFCCQYCGQRPPDVVLEVDHIHPVSKGGTDDSLNLLTSCFDCNRGKRAKVISQVAPRPDADMAYLKVQQESAEIDRFLKAKRKRDKVMKAVCELLRETWANYLTPQMVPNDRALVSWLDRYGAEEIEKAIIIASPSFHKNRFGRNENQAFTQLMPFIGAILRNRLEDKSEVM